MKPRIVVQPLVWSCLAVAACAQPGAAPETLVPAQAAESLDAASPADAQAAPELKHEGEPATVKSDPEPEQAPGEPLAGRLLSGLADRKSHKAKLVKIWLARPQVRVELLDPGGEAVLVEAWQAGANDYQQEMMRVAGGEMLYEISREEFEALRALAPDSEAPAAR